MRHFELCVIGSGPAGQKAAIQAAKLGRSVCVIERRDVLGGASVNTGTIPSKALREAILRLGKRDVGQWSNGDWRQAREALLNDLLAACHAVITAEADIIRDQFRRNGIVVIHGVARFVDPHTIEVRGAHSLENLRADHVLIAVGTCPARPPDVPFDERIVFTSDELPRLPVLPRSIIVVGGGVIGTEYASMLATLGIRVTLVESRPRLLDFVDAEIIEALQYHLRQSGATLRLGEKVVRIETRDPPPGWRASHSRLVEAVLESGKVLRADALLYAVGRQGQTDDLNLPAAGLHVDERGRLSVNAHYQTAVPHIYACGDVIGFPALASTSMEQGRLAALHMFGTSPSPGIDLLPYGIYAIPEISMVGWTEERLTHEGIPYEVGVAQYSETARGQLLGDHVGRLKMLIHQDSHTVLGVHVLGTGATELIHIGQAVMAHRGTAEYFVDTVFNYPTLAECYKVAAMNGLNKLRNA